MCATTRNSLATICLLAILPLRLRGQTATNESPADLSQKVAALTALVDRLQARVDELEKKARPTERNSVPAAGPPVAAATTSASTGSSDTSVSNQSPSTSALVQQSPDAPRSTPAPASRADWLQGTTVNLLFDGYYGYNFNDPIGRVNLLRAYDVTSNGFSLNQAALVFENAPDPANAKRYGLRIDLQFGQATATLQGNPANEPRPDIYRNIFQAYGTYVFPLGKGLTVDFGKFASSLGIEGNYSKDQINYSRSFWFDFLPFYHMGIRANYKVTDSFSVNYWIDNGTQQTEPFNSFKDQFVGLTLVPNKKVTWNVNYYLGQEHPDVTFFNAGGAPAGLPTEQGIPFAPITHAPTGKLHILDSYVTWQINRKLTMAAEGDYVIERLLTNSAPQHTDGGAGYLQYQWTPKLAIAGRVEYLSDRGGLFAGTTEALKESTFTTKYTVADGFTLFGDWRRDFSNQPYFLTDRLGVLKKEQNTATLGLIWWFGGKQGTW